MAALVRGHVKKSFHRFPESGIVLAGYTRSAVDLNTIHILLRLTARISMVLFVCALVGRAASRRMLPGWTDPFRLQRSRFLLALAASHSVHLVLVVSGLVISRGRMVSNALVPTLVFGGLGFACIYYLAVEGNGLIPATRWWRRLEGFATWYVFAIFFLAMLGGTLHRSGGHALGLLLLMVTAVLNLLRPNRIAEPLSSTAAA